MISRIWYIPIFYEACKSLEVSYEYEYSVMNKNVHTRVLDSFTFSILSTGLVCFKNGQIELTSKSEEEFMRHFMQLIQIRDAQAMFSIDSRKQLYSDLKAFCKEISASLVLKNGLYTCGTYAFAQRYQDIVHTFMVSNGLEGNALPATVKYKNIIKALRKELQDLKKELIVLFITKDTFREDGDQSIQCDIRIVSQESALFKGKKEDYLQLLNDAYEKLLFKYNIIAASCCLQQFSSNYYWDENADIFSDNKIAVLHLVDKSESYFFVRHNVEKNHIFNPSKYTFQDENDSYIQESRDGTQLSNDSFIEKNLNGDEYVAPSTEDFLLTNFLNIFGDKSGNNYIVLINDSTECEYFGESLSQWTKEYIKNLLSKTQKMCCNQMNAISDIIFFDEFLKKIVPHDPATYYLEKYEEIKNNNNISITSIGEIVESYSGDIIKNYAIASDHYVRTLYKVVDEENDGVSLIPVYSDDGEILWYEQDSNASPHFAYESIEEEWEYDYSKYEKLFSEISDNATRNLKILDSPDIVSALATSEWLYSNIGAINGLDNTFICAGYFKLMEILLSVVIRQCYSDEASRSMFDLKGNPIDFDNEEQSNRILMLRRMISFLVNRLGVDSDYNEWQKTIQDALESWLVSTRNGYFHKDILTSDEVLNIRCKTMEIIYIILGVFVKDI